MTEERKRMKFEVLLERYFKNFPKILLLNLIFFVPSLVFGGISWLLVRMAGNSTALVVVLGLLPMIPLFPFYAGVVAVCRNIARGDENVNVFPLFFSAIKENFFSFLLHGAVFYAATLLSFFSISMYVGMLSLSWFFYVLLFICIVIVLFVFFTMFYVPLMTVTFDIKLRHVYKNAFLMSFGEFKNNLFATFALAVVLAVSVTIIFLLGSNFTAIMLIFIVLWALVLPATCTFSVIFFIYDGMYNLITQKEERKRELEETIANGGKKVQKKETFREEDFSDIDVSSLKNPDDYIFHNGKMVKQSVIINHLKAKESEKNESDIKDDKNG